jgi:hypothetical protein
MINRVAILKWFIIMPMALKAACVEMAAVVLSFAENIGIQKELYKFIATDGEHEAKIDTNGIC